jgi:DNA invertase Pin-like site-specific DNA recombinase
MPCVYGYTRKSVTDGPTLMDLHQRVLERYARSKLPSLEYAGAWVEEASARTRPLACRPAGVRLSLAADRGDHVLVADYDRGFRNARELAALLEVWGARGVQLHVLDIGLEPLTPAGRQVAQAFRIAAQAEKFWAKEKGQEEFARRRREGKALTGVAPPGFRYAGPRGRRRLVPDEDDQAIMRKIIRWRMAGHTWEAIYLHLAKHGVKTPRGAEWSMGRILRAYQAGLLLEAERAQQEELCQAEGAAAASTPSSFSPDGPAPS